MLSMYVCNVKYNAKHIGGQKLKKTKKQKHRMYTIYTRPHFHCKNKILLR